jgi:hypothetical protein
VSVASNRVVRLLAVRAIGVSVAIGGFFVFLRSTDVGYHRLGIQNETDTTIVVSMGVAAFSPSHSAIPAHSLKGSQRFSISDTERGSIHGTAAWKRVHPELARREVEAADRHSEIR